MRRTETLQGQEVLLLIPHLESSRNKTVQEFLPVLETLWPHSGRRPLGCLVKPDKRGWDGEDREESWNCPQAPRFDMVKTAGERSGHGMVDTVTRRQGKRGSRSCLGHEVFPRVGGEGV